MRAIAIAQPAALGDVVMCLPLAAAVKAARPETPVIFIGRGYSQPLIEACTWIDRYLDTMQVVAEPRLLAEAGIDALVCPYLQPDIGRAARQAGIRLRIGNLRRPSSWTWANRFIWQTSREAQRHRALLNLAYLRPLGLPSVYGAAELARMTHLGRPPALDPPWSSLLEPGRFHLVLHPGSNGSGREWPAAYFEALPSLLPADRLRILVTGSREEGERLRRDSSLLSRDGVVDLTGRLSLGQLIALLGSVDGFVGCGTGPLHLAAARGCRTLGLFPTRRMSNAVRWHPLGPHAEALTSPLACTSRDGRCAIDRPGGTCPCMKAIHPAQVAGRVAAWMGERSPDGGSIAAAGSPAT